MKVLIYINYEELEINVSNNLEFSINEIYEKIEQIFGLDKELYYLKLLDININDTISLTNILKEESLVFDELLKSSAFEKDYKLDFYWNNSTTQILNIDINDLEYSIPSYIVNESISSIMFNNTTNDKIYFKNECLKNKYLINDWIKLYAYTKRFKNIIPIPKPVDQCNLDQFIGEEASLYLNNLDLDRLKDLASGFDYLGIDNLLEIVCANIAVKYVYKYT
jgi:hypothetical protein